MLIQPNYNESSFTPMVPGKHLCKVISCEMRKSKKTNNKYLNWKLHTKGGHTVFYITMIEGPGSGMLRHFIKCFVSDYQEGAFDTDLLIGRVCEAELGIKKVEAIGGGSPKEFYEVKIILPAPQVYEQEAPQDIPPPNDSDIPW